MIGTMKVEARRDRINASKNGFVRQCCQQEIGQLTEEKRMIEAEVVG